MRPVRLLAAAASSVLLVSLAACGGAQSSPENAADAFLEAFVEADAEAVCALATEDKKPLTGDDLDECVEGLKAILDDEAYTGEETATLKKALDQGASKVEEDGDSATVTYEVDGDEEKVELVKHEGDWYVSNL